MTDPDLTPVCPDVGALARAVSHGPDEAMRAHLRHCARCDALVREHRELVELAARVPFVAPAHDRTQRVRDALVAGTPVKAARRGSYRVLAAFAGGFLAVAVAIGLFLIPLLRPTPPSISAQPASRAVIEAASGARFERLSGPPNEVVRLYEGTIRTTVPPATRGETLRIVTGEGEVAVRGTVFDTTARDDRLVAVKVQRGRVVVRRAAAPGASGASSPPELALEAGQSWALPPEPDDFTPPPPPQPAPRPPKLQPRPPAPSDPAEQAFGEGLALLRRADPAGAARAFDRAVRLAPLGTLAEDASYWHAVALMRAGNQGGEEALAAFIDRFPQSARAGEASVMLGWLLLDRGDSQAALTRFEAGLADRSARVRKSAEAGRDAIARKGAR